jgi:hypothetical protein
MGIFSGNKKEIVKENARKTINRNLLNTCIKDSRFDEFWVILRGKLLKTEINKKF